MLARRYNVITNPVPNKSARGRFRRGSRTSPAVNVILFQASAENKEPTCPTQIAINIPSAPPVAETVPMNGRSDVIGETDVGVQKFVKLACSASALHPTKMPNATTAMSDNVLAEVKTFWMSLPSSSPRVFTKVREIITKIATNCCVERLTAYRCESMIGGTIHRVGETISVSTPRNLANATATAAIVPVCITRIRVQPYRNPHSGLYASSR